jgi:Creb binding
LESNNVSQKQAIQKLIQTLKSDPGPEQQQLLQILKTSLQLMTPIIKQQNVVSGQAQNPQQMQAPNNSRKRKHSDAK